MAMNDPYSPRSYRCALLTLAASLCSRELLAADDATSSSEPATAGEAAIANETASLAAGPLDHPASVLDEFAERAHDSRIWGAWWSIGGGAALTVSGLLTAYTGERDSYGHFVWASGALSLAGGVLELFLPSDLERLERDSGGRTPGYTPGALQASWKEKAGAARTLRHIGGITNLTLGAAGITAGSLLAAGVGDLSGSNRTAWSVSTFIAGGLLTLGGVVTLLRPSGMERGYQIAFPNPSVRADISVAPLPGGGALQLFGTF